MHHTRCQLNDANVQPLITNENKAKSNMEVSWNVTGQLPRLDNLIERLNITERTSARWGTRLYLVLPKV